MYQPEFEDCWASGLVSQHDPRSHIMEIAMDKVNNIMIFQNTFPFLPFVSVSCKLKAPFYYREMKISW